MLNTDRLLVQILLLALLGACLWVLAPFWSALFWAAVLAFASWPLMRWLTRVLNNRPGYAAALLTAGWVLLVAVPLIMLGFNLADHIRELNTMIKDFQVSGLPPAPTWLDDVPLVGDRLVAAWQAVDKQGASVFASLQPYFGQMGNWLLARSAKIASGMIELALSLVLLFFFYRDGPRLAAFVYSLLERLIGKQPAQHYIDLVTGTIQRVVNGVIGTAVGQAILAYIGFIIAGVPGAMVLAILTFACSLLMFPPLVWGPATAWLFWNGEIGMGIFMGLWGFFVISGVDNILKPYLISRGGNLPLVVVLLGVFGGILAFGFMGLFLGPTLLAVAFSLLNDWVANKTPESQEKA